MNCETYRRVLGDKWWMLAESVRRAHEAGVERTGVFSITRGTSRLAWVLTRWLRLPRPSPAAATKLRITADDLGEQWERKFDADAFVTRQWAGSNGYLVERFEAWELHFELQIGAGGSLSYVQRGARLRLGWISLRIPLACAPVVSASETADDESKVRVSVTVNIPLVGLLIGYRGHLDIGGMQP